MFSSSSTPLPRRHRVLRRARACLAGMAAVFALCQLALGVFIGTYHPEWRDPRYGWVESQLRKRRPQDSALVVMLGSSRTHSGFDAGRLEPPLSKELGRPVTVANFGVSGGGPFGELLTMHRLLHDGHRPDLVLVDVTPPFMNGNEPLAEVSSDRLPSGRLRPFELPLVARYRQRPLLAEWADWIVAWSVPCVSFRTEMLSTLWQSSVPEKLKEPAADRFGWLRLPADRCTAAQQQAREDAARAEYAQGLQQFDLHGPNVAALYELLDLLQKEQIPAVLVLSSESAEFQKLYRPGAQAEITALAEDVRRRYGLPILDARSWFDTDRFLDLHHLHPEAAGEFTDRLCAEAIVPLMARGTALARRP